MKIRRQQLRSFINNKGIFFRLTTYNIYDLSISYKNSRMIKTYS